MTLLVLIRKKSKIDEGFHFSFADAEKVGLSLVPNVAGSEIHSIVTYDPETHFDVNKNKFERSVWRESSFEVISFSFFHCS